MGEVPGASSLTDSWALGPLRVPNRVLLAPLAGIGNWFVRLQAKRYGAGMAFSEMVSSHAIHYRNQKTCIEMLRIDPRERAGGPVSIQLFGEDPAIMRSAAAHIAANTSADAIDINMGCPVPKVRKTGAGAAMLADPDLAVAVTRAAREGAAEGLRARVAGRARPNGSAGGSGELPVTVKLRSGLRPGERSGYLLAHRLVEEAGAAAIVLHPRSAAVHHKGQPDYEMVAQLVGELDAPVILTGGLHDADSTLAALDRTGAAAVMLARGALGNPWLFEQLLGARRPGQEPSSGEVLKELNWTIERAVEHIGEQRATRYLRKFYPWYVARLGLVSVDAKRLGESLQTAPTLGDVRALLELSRPLALAPA
jgi:tRNA-dihydrouridine synthase B